MAHQGDAKAHAIFKQREYEYYANASFFLTPNFLSRDTHEPSGELDSLRAKIDPKTFGKQEIRRKVPELEGEIKCRRIQETVLPPVYESVHRPDTMLNNAIFETVLCIIREEFGEKPRHVLCSATDKVLAILKNDKVTNPVKKKDIERLLNPFSSQTFDRLFLLAQYFTNYSVGTEISASMTMNGDDGSLGDVIGAPVQSEEDGEEESGYVQVQEECHYDDDLQQPNDQVSMQMGRIDDEIKETSVHLAFGMQDIDYHTTHTTLSTYKDNLEPTMDYIELFRLFSLSEEFKYVTLNLGEKMELTALLDLVPIPVKESLEESSAKINVLLQACISRLMFDCLSLATDMVFIRKTAGHLLRALFDIVLKSGWAQLAQKALNLCKMFERRMWSFQTPLRQFYGMPNEILVKLEEEDMPWERYYELTAQQLGELICFPEMGNTLYTRIRQLPKVNLAAHVQPISRTILGLELKITPDFQWDYRVNGYYEPFWAIVEDSNGEYILHHEYFVLTKQYIEEDHYLSFIVPIYEQLLPQYLIRVVSDRWLAFQSVLPVCFSHLIHPEKHFLSAELLDSQLLPVTALGNPSYEALYDSFKHFNPIQTQVFTVLYNTDDNVLVAAPTGSGKTICAEFAILRNHQGLPESMMRVVYIAPIDALAKERYHDWRDKFGKHLGISVVELMGETATDLKLFETGQIIISTPEKWDALSRRWNQRKYVQQVSLFIADELHLIGGSAGPILEIVVSRIRRIASHTGSNIRIVALSASPANAEDLGEWIGATSQGLFNFPPGVRPLPFEIHIQGVDIAGFEARTKAMSKHTYNAIAPHAKNRQTSLVFVPTRKHARLTALDLYAYSCEGSSEKPTFLPDGPTDETEASISRITDYTLKLTLPTGVGYLHEDLCDSDQEVVKQLFFSRRIQVCVASSSLRWGVSLPADVVVVMGTQLCDGRENAHADCSITDLMQMMSHACRPFTDSFGKCVILCHAPRTEYYEKFLCEAFTVESHLHHSLHDCMNAEVAFGMVKNKQDAVDYFIWTFLYRRLKKNPKYYNLQCVSHGHLSAYLSDLMESTLKDLESSKCVIVEEDMHLKYADLGLLASHHYISYTTVERFSSSLSPRTKMKDLLQILASASEFAQLPVRPGEQDPIRKMMVRNPKCTDPHVKANLLLQAHFSRRAVDGDLATDRREVLLLAYRLLLALVDVISCYGWLKLTLAAMEMCQMFIQAIWVGDSELLQFPHFTHELAKRCRENPGRSIEGVFDLVVIEDDERRRLLQMNDAQMLDIARFCKSFPDIDLYYEVLDDDGIHSGEHCTLQVTLERCLEDCSEVGPVDAPWFVEPKEEGWWLVVGDSSSGHLLGSKRVVLQRRAEYKLVFEVPKEVGKKTLTIYFMCDSYLGSDQEYNFTIDVKEFRQV